MINIIIKSHLIEPTGKNRSVRGKKKSDCLFHVTSLISAYSYTDLKKMNKQKLNKN